MGRSRVYRPRTSSPAANRTAAVERIYRDERGDLPNFSRLDRRPPVWRRWAVAGGLVTLAALAVAAWASFLIFKPYAASSGGNLAATIEAPPTAGVGDEVTYRIRIANADRVPIARAEVELRLPPDFAVVTTNPAPDDARGYRWTIGAIPGDAERTIDVRGRVYGTPGGATRVDALVFYRPGNFNADFQTIATTTTALSASPVTLTVAGPERTVPGQPVTYVATYEHTGDRPTPATALLIELPRSFTLTGTKPNRPQPDDLRWLLGELAPQAKGTIELQGTYTAEAKGPLTIRAVIALELAPDRRLPQVEEIISTEVIGGDVVLLATVNDQTNGIDARPGDALRFRIAIRNDGSAALRSLTARAVFEATAIGERSILNFNAITDAARGAAIGQQLKPSLRRGTITWTTKEIPGLAELPPGEVRQIDFVLPLHTAASLPGFPPSGRAAFTATVEIGETGDLAQPRTIPSHPMEIRVSSGT